MIALRDVAPTSRLPMSVIRKPSMSWVRIQITLVVVTTNTGTCKRGSIPREGVSPCSFNFHPSIPCE